MKNLSTAEYRILERLLAYCSDELSCKRKHTISIANDRDNLSILKSVYNHNSPQGISFEDYIRHGHPEYLNACPFDLTEYFYNKIQQIIFSRLEE